MTKLEIIKEEVKKSNGYLIFKDIIKKGVSKTFLINYVQKNKLERVARGVYLSKEGLKDDMYILSLKNQKAILSYESALDLHGLTKKEPSNISVTVLKSYNATHLRTKGVKVHQVSEDLINMGKINIETKYGNDVIAYDMERTICDVIKNKDRMDSQTFSYAMKKYSKNKNKNIDSLMNYAQLLGIEDTVTFIMDLL